MTRQSDTITWSKGLPRAFVELCDAYEISNATQARVLALALRSNRGDIATTTVLSANQIEDILERLTPIRQDLMEEGEDATDSDEGSLMTPIGGALPPEAMSPIAHGMRGSGEVDLRDVKGDATDPKAPNLTKPAKGKEDN